MTVDGTQGSAPTVRPSRLKIAAGCAGLREKVSAVVTDRKAS